MMSDGSSLVSDFTDRIPKPLGVCYGFATVFKLSFTTFILGEGVLVGGRQWYRSVGKFP